MNLLKRTKKNEFKRDNKVLKLPNKKNFYTKNFLILFIQYIVIIALTITGFKYKLNEKLIDADVSLSIKYIPFITLIFSLNIVIAFLSEFKASKIMIIFHIFYPAFIIYYSFLFSSFIDSKYIIIGLSLVGLELFSLLSNILFELYEIKYFLINSLLFSSSGFIIFSVFWIKYLFPILYISIFWLLSNGYYVLWIFLINKKFQKNKLNQYYYSSLIFNYGIFLAISHFIKYSIHKIKNYIEERIDNDDEEIELKKKFYLYKFIILFIQFAFIIIITIVGFKYKVNEILIEVDASLFIKYFPVIAFVFLLTIIIACVYEYRKNRIIIIFHIFYPGFIIYYSFLFSSFIDSKYIIIGISLIGIEILSLLLNVFLKNFELIHFGLYSASFSLIGLIFFSVFWIKSWLSILYTSIFWLLSNAIYIFLNYIINKLLILEFDEYFFSTLIFDYNIILAFSFLIKYCYDKIINYIRDRINDNNDELNNKKYFYLFNFIILIIQYVVIITATILGFEYKFNIILIKWQASLAVKYIPFLAFILVSCIVIMSLYGYKTNKCLIIFHIIYPLFIIYYSFLFSSFIDTKYIIIGLSLIGIEILSLLFNIFLKKFETKHYFLFSFLFSIIGLIIFSVFWIKSRVPILYVSIFLLLSNAIYIGIILAIHKYCLLNEYFYSSLIFDYNLILFIFLIIYKVFECLFHFCKEEGRDDEVENKIKKFGILLLQYIIITIFVWIGFAFRWNYNIRDNSTAIQVLFGISLTVDFFICIIYICSFNDPDCEGFYIFGIIFRVPLMIIYIYAFSIFFENKYILSYVFILFLDILSIFIFVACFNLNFLAAFFSCLFSNIVAIIPFHFFWLNNTTALTWLIVLSIFTNFYLSGMIGLVQEKFKNNIIFSVLTFNYGAFSGILYSIYQVLKFVCEKLANNIN